MNKKEIECIARLNSLNGAVDDILEYLMGENLLQSTEIKSIKLSSELHKDLYKTLKQLRHYNKIQLIEYEWNVLPVERIKITFVTDNSQREFTYNF